MIFRDLVAQYMESADYSLLAQSTKRQWVPWLSRLSQYFGKLPVSAFDRTQDIKRIIRTWREDYRDRPRAADYGMQVLSRLLSYAVEGGDLASNPCAGFRRIYRASRAPIVWSEEQLALLRSVASAPLMRVVDLALATGLRKGDLCNLRWDHVRQFEIVIPTGKSGGRVNARVPVSAELSALLSRIEQRDNYVLLNHNGRHWSRDGLGTAINRAMHRSGLSRFDLHFNDLRGTAATKFYLSGIPVREIAEIMGWTETSVDRIMGRYVDRHAATLARVARMQSASHH